MNSERHQARQLYILWGVFGLNWCQQHRKVFKKSPEMRRWLGFRQSNQICRTDCGPGTVLALREVIRGTSTECAPAALRLHDHVSLHFSATDDGPRTAACVFEDESAAHGR